MQWRGRRARGVWWSLQRTTCSRHLKQNPSVTLSIGSQPKRVERRWNTYSSKFVRFWMQEMGGEWSCCGE